MIKMKKPLTSIIAIILIVLASLIFYIFFLIETPSPPKEKIFFSEKAEHWVYDNPSTIEEDTKIDVFKATDGRTKLEPSQQNYFTDTSFISFFYFGMYQGISFDSIHLPENFLNTTQGMSLSEKKIMAESLTKMHLTNEFNPNDGVINGFILAKQENSKMVFYIFIDQDWKSSLPYTNIVWGDNFQNPPSLNERSFDFSKFEEGVYIDKLEEDVDWFTRDARYGGIIVGEISKNMLTQNLDEINTTYMMVR